MNKWYWVVLCLCLWSCKELPKTPYKLPNDVHLQEGDLAFRLGRSKESVAVSSSDHNAQYSHVGLVVEEEGKWYVIHEVPDEATDGQPDRIKKDPIETFFRYDRAKRGSIMRWKTEDTCIYRNLAQYVLYKYSEQILFDNDFDKDDSTKIYCTELIYLAFRSQGIDITEGRAKKVPYFPTPIILPSDILQNEQLEVVYSFINE